MFVFNKKYKDTIENLTKELDVANGLLLKYSGIEEKLKYFNDIDLAVEVKATELESLELLYDKKRQELIDIEKEITTSSKIRIEQTLCFHEPRFRFNDNVEYKKRITDIIYEQKQMVKQKMAVIMPSSKSVVFNGNSRSGNNLVKLVADLVLIIFNSYCNDIIDKAKSNSYSKNMELIEKKFNRLNDMASMLQVKISENYLCLKSEQLEVKVANEYWVDKEKEDKRIQKEMLKEQEIADKEIEKCREKLVKEQKQYELKISKEKNQDKIKELEFALDEINQNIEQNEYKLKNKKCGHLYIISNPDMKDGVYKIGLTRRIEPTVRVDELSNASHAFRFNIHALVFSDDVFDLEGKMHKYFYEQRVNKVNIRKEFFEVSLNEIHTALKSFGYDVEMNEHPINEQYEMSKGE